MFIYVKTEKASILSKTNRQKIQSVIMFFLCSKRTSLFKLNLGNTPTY